MIYSFPPMIDGNSKILILGSIPSIVSLKTQRYYGNPQNNFWKIIVALFETAAYEDSIQNREFEAVYERGVKLASSVGIALWDTIAFCEREGSLDQSIKHEEFNDIGALLVDYPLIEAVFCNGRKAEKNYKLLCRQQTDPIKKKRLEEVPYFYIPSSSPIPTRNCRCFEDRVSQWSIISEVLKH